MYDALKNKNLFNFDESIARDIFTDREFPWEVLPHIGEFILTLGAGLPADEYEQKGENIWIARSATIAPTASINGPCIIGKNAEIRHRIEGADNYILWCILYGRECQGA